MGGVSQVVEQARDTRTRDLGQQYVRNKMFCALMQRACMTVGCFTDEKTSEPHDDKDGNYLDFFTMLVAKMEEGA